MNHRVGKLQNQIEPIYSLRDISLRRGSSFVLHVDSLEIFKRHIYALAGSNGAGKSTLLGILAMLTPPAKGTLHFAGNPVRRKSSELKELRRQITLVEQAPYLFDGSVTQNLAFGLRLRGIRGKEQCRRIAQALEDVGLSGFEGRSAQALSGGEARRVALARALVLQPKVLLLDEPTANVDGESLSSFEALMTTLPQQGMTVVFSTHDPEQAGRLGAEVIRMHEGRLEAVSCPASPQPQVTVTEEIVWPRPLKMPEPSF